MFSLTKCTFTIRGILKVKHDRLGELEEKYGESALKNVKVKISAKKKRRASWSKWGKTTTNLDDVEGGFRLSKRKSCKDRYIRVQVKFQSDDLEIRHKRSSSSATKVKWYTVYESEGKHEPGTIQLGELVFREGGENDLGDFEARSHAELWVLYNKVFSKLRSMGSDLAFKDKVKVKYPHDSFVLPDAREASYANPVNHVIYIIKNSVYDDFSTGTLLHELMHIWAYQHTRGELGLALELIKNGTTHGTVDKTWVAFHEGFAEYAKDKLKEILFKKGSRLPYNRDALTWGIPIGASESSRDVLENLNDIQHNDEGWRSALHLLTTKNLYLYDFKEPNTGTMPTDTYIVKKSFVKKAKCAQPNIAFSDVLGVFLSKSGYKNITKKEMNVEDFFARASGIIEGFDEEVKEKYLKLLDPNRTVQPADLFCTSILKGS